MSGLKYGDLMIIFVLFRIKIHTLCTTIVTSVQTLYDNLSADEMLFNGRVFCTNLRTVCAILQQIDEYVTRFEMVRIVDLFANCISILYRIQQQQSCPMYKIHLIGQHHVMNVLQMRCYLHSICTI